MSIEACSIKHIYSFVLFAMQIIYYSYCKSLVGLSVRFTQSVYNGSEVDGYVSVSIELVGGTVDVPFDVTITSSEQSPVSAEG